MRLKLYFTMENEVLPIQYRRSILSFMKKSLQEYNEEYFNLLFHEKDIIIKPYTFAIFFNNPKFEKDIVRVEDKKFEMNISIADYETGMMLYNGFNHQKGVKFPLNHNSMTLEKITILNEFKILNEELMIKFMSPLVVREHNTDTGSDKYYSFEDSNFKETLKRNIKDEIKITELPIELVNTFDIEPIKPKKVVVLSYDRKIGCSTGTYKIKGDRNILQYLYQAGMGSKKSIGFGMFSII